MNIVILPSPFSCQCSRLMHLHIFVSQSLLAICLIYIYAKCLWFIILYVLVLATYSLMVGLIASRASAYLCTTYSIRSFVRCWKSDSKITVMLLPCRSLKNIKRIIFKVDKVDKVDSLKNVRNLYYGIRWERGLFFISDSFKRLFVIFFFLCKNLW